MIMSFPSLFSFSNLVTNLKVGMEVEGPWNMNLVARKWRGEIINQNSCHKLHYSYSTVFHQLTISETDGTTKISLGISACADAHARPSAQCPIDTSGNFSAQVSGGEAKNSDQFSRHFRRLKALFVFSEEKNLKNRGGPPPKKKLLFTPNIVFFVT